MEAFLFTEPSPNGGGSLVYLRRGIRSTTVVLGRLRASFTGMNSPVLASRPINIFCCVLAEH